VSPENENQNPQPQPAAPLPPVTPSAQPAQATNGATAAPEIVSPAQNGVVVSGGGGIDLPPVKQPGKSKKKLVIIVGIVLIAALIAAGAYFVLKSNDKAASSKTPQKASSTQQKSQADSQAQAEADSQLLADSERKSDINDLSSLLQTYTSTRGKFPMLSEINDLSFRTTYLPALDTSLLRDPDASQPVLVATPTKGAYSYEVTDRDGNTCSNDVAQQGPHGPFHCSKYKLTAILSNGTKFEKNGEAP
jgi:hypothetical protein